MSNSKKNVNSASQVSGKKSIKDIHQDLGFGSLPDNYDVAGSGLDIDPVLKKELDDANLVYRFINFKEYKRKGFHKAHWKPYKRSSAAKHGAVFTQDPDGYTVKQDLVLAVKPKDWNEAHAKLLKQKADRLADPQALASQKMKEAVEQSGGKVVTGYEDNE